ncbi:MAG: LLM class flavin-dependent oxidoreductase, partial [Deltaproteobacteria bacterium]|nr:LLM class flavin-dependent oxidoreductase [Deltaproteobacteria bacterium]
LKRTARFADGYFASFQTPHEFSSSISAVREYAEQFGRANARIESGLILFCRLAATRERAIEDMRPIITAMGRGSDLFVQRTLYGSPADIIERLQEYVALGLDKFVLWPVAEPAAWAQQIELIGREVASHYARAADAA